MTHILTPYKTMNRLRELRLWHWRKAIKARRSARMHEGRGYAVHDASAIKRHNARADQHIKFVQTLNDFFPAGDTAEGDDK